MIKKEFESQLQSLIGERIKKVNYYELNYGDNKDYWNDNSNFDSLDYGLELEMESGLIKGIIWGDEFYQYGISLIETSLDTELKDSKKNDVSHTSQWHKVIGKKIKNARTIWSYAEKHGASKKKIYYPQCLILTFCEDINIWISALEIRNNSYSEMSDNITVFFNESKFKKYHTTMHNIIRNDSK